MHVSLVGGKKKPLKKIEMRFLRNITNEIANPQDSSSEVL